MIDLDAVLEGYIDCALWSSTDNSRDDGGDPLDDNYDPDDIAPESLVQMRKDCEDFVALAGNALDGIDDHQIGHDFWLTRNRHGAGFWDRGHPGDIGDRLTRDAQSFGSCDLIVGDDGKVHV